MRGCLVFVLFFIIRATCLSQPVGSWQDYLSFHSAIALGENNKGILAASPWALFQYEPSDQSFSRITKLNGLSSSGISSLLVDPAITIIAYQNNQLDLLRDGSVQSVNTLRISNLPVDKKVYDIWKDQERCLLAAGFGIAVLNIEKAEIGDVYLIANGGEYTQINSITADKDFYYAGGEKGLYRASRSAINLADFRSWTLLSGSNGLPAGTVQQVVYWKEQLFVQLANRLYAATENGFELKYEDDWQWNAIDPGLNHLLISQQSANGGRVVQLNAAGSVESVLEHSLIRSPQQTGYFRNQFWIADAESGLLSLDGNFTEQLIPNSPDSVGTGALLVTRQGRNSTWWMASGETLNQFTEANWQQLSLTNLGWSPGNVNALLERNDRALWIASSKGGLGLLKDNQLTLYRENLLAEAVQEPGIYKTGGLAFDSRRQLWISNDGASKGLVLLREDGASQVFEIPFYYPSLRVTDIVVDELDQKWILSPGNGVFCLSQNNDQWRYYQAGAGNGNLPSAQVLSIARDKFGFIWIGTSNGIGIIQCASQVFSGAGCEAILPVVQSDNFAGYLFKGEAVQTMAVDGANRKWIGTKNGVWLISAGGEQTLQRFTTANSPLPDNDIRKIAIDPYTGEVLISTAQGLISYRSTATEGGNTNTNLLVYPNPVPPGYTGQIAIRGLVENAIVKITELNGRLVYQGRALGGQFIWNGLDLNGRRVATGVYPVWISNDGRTEQAVTKIVFIQQ